MSAAHEILMQTPDGFFDELDDKVVRRDENISCIVDRLEQENRFMHWATALEVDDRYHLNARVERGHQVKKFSIPLCFVNPSPVQKMMLNWKLIVAAAVVFAVVAGLMLAETSHQISGQVPYLYSVIVSLATTASIMLMVAIYQYKNVYVYSTAYGGVALFEIDRRLPNKSDVSDFMARLETHVAKAKCPEQAGVLANAVKEHRKLVEQGVISNEEYEEAKKRIFACHD